jgi:hypothetical protein
MAKENYDVSYNTYYNARIKKMIFQGEKTHPLYIRATFDRDTTFFRSYYFDLFAQPKYDFLCTTISQIVELEGRVIDYIIEWNADDFSLDKLTRQYKIFSIDILDSFDGPFKIWLAGYLKEVGLPGLAAVTENAMKEVSAIQIWDDLKKILHKEAFNSMEEKAARYGTPYIPLVAYLRHKFPEAPFCLPLHEWIDDKARQMEIRKFVDDTFRQIDFSHFRKEIQLLLLPGHH